MTPEDLIAQCQKWRPSSPKDDFKQLVLVAVTDFWFMDSLIRNFGVEPTTVSLWALGHETPPVKLQRKIVAFIVECANRFRQITNVSPAHLSYRGNRRPVKKTKSVWFIDKCNPHKQFLMNCFSTAVADRVVELWNAEAERLRDQCET